MPASTSQQTTLQQMPVVRLLPQATRARAVELRRYWLHPLACLGGVQGRLTSQPCSVRVRKQAITVQQSVTLQLQTLSLADPNLLLLLPLHRAPRLPLLLRVCHNERQLLKRKRS